MAFVHSLLSKIPDDLPFELLISQAGDLFIQYPPNVLEHEADVQYRRLDELHCRFLIIISTILLITCLQPICQFLRVIQNAGIF